MNGNDDFGVRLKATEAENDVFVTGVLDLLFFFILVFVRSLSPPPHPTPPHPTPPHPTPPYTTPPFSWTTVGVPR